MKRSLSILCTAALLAILIVSCGGKSEQTPTPEPVNLGAEEPVNLAAGDESGSSASNSTDACVQDISLPDQPAIPLVFCDNFEDPETSVMGPVEDENKWGSLKSEVYNGKYSVRVEVKRDNAMWLPVPSDELRDFIFQVDGKLTSHSGHPYHSWGVYFKADDEIKNYYYFLIDNNQYYYFQLIRGDKRTNLINGRKSEDLKPLDEGNTITVASDGSIYSFYINGKFQEDFSDNRLQSGKLGIYSEMRENTTLDWDFDNMILYAP